MPLLELKGVSKVFPGGRRALDGVSLTVEAGQATGLVGESGAGKTTLAQIAVGLVRPTSGTVAVNGAVVGNGGRINRKELSRTIQIVWQDAPGSLDPRMRVGRAVAEPLKVHGAGPQGSLRDKVLELLAEVGLAPELADRRPRGLSGGEIQRAVIARALAPGPRLLICDEPASALDARIKAQIVELLGRLRRQRGLAYLIITHDLGLVGKLADNLMVMYGGVIVETGPAARLLKNPLHPYTQLLLSSQPELDGPVAAFYAKNNKALDDSGHRDITGEGGCGFRWMCPRKVDRCDGSKPELTAVGDDRQAACFLVEG